MMSPRASKPLDADRRLLTVLVVEADLKVHGNLDSSVRAGLFRVDGKEVKDEVFTSPAVKNSNHPVYRSAYNMDEDPCGLT